MSVSIDVARAWARAAYFAGNQIAKRIIQLIEKGQEPKEIQDLLDATILRRGTDNPPLADKQENEIYSQ